ncbi:leucine-rich repeat-containing protein 40 [Exaiptasia diaphana]|uniref:Leucine-rich repeat-containing protein 40 n=1 Tax=Exaiptasia diaphana TaxID=2652724 RepID=A0A913XE52_EXADI|nr:leucine-rich repeat-containing protein 40 [Exaiptasia diaphana]KXJ12812.1 Leucine-rich repeat-containing protein 40 [Exaiptasia diaphana]
MKRRPVNPAFKGRGLDIQDKSDVSDALLGQARRSGQLNLSNRQLVEVPKKVWNINIDLPTEAKNVSLDSTHEKWWDQIDLTKLILASNKLTALSSEIANLPALEFLDIHDNVIESLPKEIGSLENIKRLNLSHNKLTCLRPEIGHLSNLCSLKIQHNSLQSIGDWLGELIHLEDLDLSNNKVIAVPSNISRLGSLRNLNLSNNCVETLPVGIGSVKLLEDLNLSNNKLTSLPQELGNSNSLKRLDCRQNMIESFPCLSKCTSLKELYLGNNRISKIDSSDLNGLPCLSILDLRDNKIDIIPDEITVLSELERIDLSNNEISSLPFTMGTMQHLKAVILDGNPLRKLRRDIVMRGTQAILKYLKSRIVEEEKPPCGVADSVDSKVPDRPDVSMSGSSSTIDQHSLTQTKALSYSNKRLSEIPHEVMEAAVTARVTKVDLSKNLLNSLPHRLAELSECLSDLNLGFNKFQSLQDSFGCFSKLQFLDLRNNQISDLPSSLSGLVSLLEVTLSFNRLSSLPSVLYSIPSIRTILASDNKIESIDVAGFLRLPVLETLDLQNNSISVVPPELGNVTTLRALQLGGNSFRNPRAAILAKGTPSLLEYLRSRIPT